MSNETTRRADATFFASETPHLNDKNDEAALAAGFLAPSDPEAQATILSVGDIAFTAVQTEANGNGTGDFFQFVLTRPVTAGTTIYFTDSGFLNGTGKFRTVETVLRWVAQTDLPAKSLISFNAPDGGSVASTAEWTGINPLTGAALANASLALQPGGEQIAAFVDPVFGGTDNLGGTAIAAINIGDYLGNFTTSTSNNVNESALPTGLTLGVNAVQITRPSGAPQDYDDVVYQGRIEGSSPAAIAAAVNNASSWAQTQTPFVNQAYTPTFQFTTVAVAQSEGSGGDTIMTFTINRAYDVGAANVSWALAGSGGSPATAADFAGGALPSGTVNFVDGQATATITVFIAGDADVEGNEQFTLSLVGMSSGYTIGAQSTAIGTINNDDARPPVLGGAGGNVGFTENGAAVVIAADLTATDADNVSLAGATVAIQSAVAGDQLNFTNQNGITGAYNAATGVLTLTGSATVDAYQAALRSVTYSSTSDDPTADGARTTRTISFTATDGFDASTPVTSTVTVTAVNDAPVFSAAFITRASSTSAGANPNNFVSFEAGDISADATRVVFSSNASNLTAASDTNNVPDIFLKDLTTGAVTVISTDANGGAANGTSLRPILSPDGTRVIFNSAASNLVAGDTNNTTDVFIKTIATGAIERISVSASGLTISGGQNGIFSADGTKVAFTSGGQIYVKTLSTGELVRVSTDGSGVVGNGSSDAAVFSPDGTKIAFTSSASNLVAGDTNGISDIFVKDLVTGVVTRVSVATDGSQADSGGNFTPAFSPDGTRIAFRSSANNLSAADTDGTSDIFVRDLSANTTTLVSADVNGVGANQASQSLSVRPFSPDGNSIYFSTNATNLIAGSIGVVQIYAKNLVTGVVTRVSTTETGAQVTSNTFDAIVAANGAVLIRSDTRLVASDTDNFYDQFVVNLTNGSQTYVENGAPLAVIGNATVSDVDSGNYAGGTFNAAISSNANAGDVLTLASTGTSTGISVVGNSVRFNGTEIGILTTNGSGFSVALDSDATDAAVKALAEAVRFASASENPGSATRSVTLSLTDGANATSNIVRTIAVTPVNDAPSGTDASVVIAEDAPRTLTIADFGFTDADANSFTQVTITTAPTAGTLRVGGTFVTAGTVITAAQLNANSVVYTPGLNGNGTGYASFTFQVQDNGGTANGGVNIDPTPNTFTVNVQPQNDAPEIANLAADAATYVEGSLTRVALDVGQDALVTDVDNLNFNGGSLTVTITNAVAGDQLWFGARGGIANTATQVTFNGVGFASFNSVGSSRLFTFNSNATPEAVTALIRAMEFINSGSDNNVARAVSFVLADGSGGSRTINSQVNITGVNDAPRSTGFDNVTFTEGQGFVQLDTGFDQVLTDPDSANFDGGTLTIRVSGNKVASEDAISFLSGGTSFLSFSNGVVSYQGVAFGTVSPGGAGNDRVVTFNTNASVEAVQTLMRNIVYSNSNDAAPSTAPRTISYTLTDGDGGTLELTSIVNVAAVNDAPALTAPTQASIGYTEGGSPTLLMQGVVLSDVDAPASFAGGSISLTVGGVGGGINLRAGSNFSINPDGNGGFVLVETASGAVIGQIAGFGTTNVQITGLTSAATQARLNDLVDDFGYINLSDAPDTSPRTVTLTVNDGGNSGSGGSLSATRTQTLTVTNVNDPVAVAAPAGTQAGTEDRNLVFSAATGNALSVADPDGQPITVTLSVANGTLTLSRTTGLSFANGDGTADAAMTFTGTPAAINAALEGLVYRGNLNFSGSDAVQFAVSDGATNASSSIAITLAPDGQITGDPGNNNLDGTPQNDFFNLGQGGDENLRGYEGNDGFYFGATYNNRDVIDGGAGNLDQIGLQGDYAAGVTLGSLNDVEMVVILPGSDARFGDTSGALYSYNIIAPDATVAAGKNLAIQANTLRAGENLTFDGSAETDGSFLVYAGFGIDTLTGGAGNDGFLFGDGRFGASDRVNGGAGTLDQIGLQGNYTGARAVTFGANQLSNLEFIVLLSASDTRFGAVGGVVAYDVTMNDGNVLAGQRMIVQGNTLKPGETLTFDGSAELDGAFQIFSGQADDVLRGSQGADDIWAGAGADRITGNGGADTLRGGAGNDTFLYNRASDSTSAARDSILDFATGDLVDFAGLVGNTGGGSYSFIGGNAQSGARQVQVIQNGNAATVNVFVDGDNVADLVINVTVADGHALTSADFSGLDAVPPQESLKSAGQLAMPDIHGIDAAPWQSFDHNLPFNDFIL